MLGELTRLMNSMGMSTSAVPAIIPQSYSDIEEKIERVSGFVNRVQIDVMDGVYTPKASWPFSDTRQREEFQEMVLKRDALSENISFEVDMLVKDPQYFIDSFMDVGAHGLIIHLESTHSTEEIIGRVKDRGVEVGIAIRPSTDIKLLLPYLAHIDSVQMMGSDRVGFGGIPLDGRVYGRIKDLRTLYRGIIAVDIGVTKETAPKLVEAGATKLVSGSSVFASDSPEETLRFFKELQ